jgi:hypothetical protein
MPNKTLILMAVILLCPTLAVAAPDDAPLLARTPSINRTQMAFAYGGYLWSVPGKAARRANCPEATRIIFLPMETGWRLPGITTATSTP